MHRQLSRVSNLYALASRTSTLLRSQRATEALAAVATLAELTSECWMYAAEQGFHATQRLSEEIARAHVESDAGIDIPIPLADRIIAACWQTANVLAEEVRRELDIPLVSPQAGITKTTKLDAVTKGAEVRGGGDHRSAAAQETR